MTDNMLGQENKPTELRNEKTDSLQVNFVGWGGAILSLLSVIFAMKSTTIQNEFLPSHYSLLGYRSLLLHCNLNLVGLP